MSPAQFSHDHHQNHHQHVKREQLIHGVCPPPLKINKESYFIKKSPPSSSSSSASSLVKAAPTPPKPQQQRPPVIIYTHSPKIIHTHPRDFMALVQKLTGLSHSEDDTPRAAKSAPAGNEISEASENNNNNNKNKGVLNGSFSPEDNESSSVITAEENSGSSLGDGQVNSCFLPKYFDPTNPYLTNMPVFTPNPAEFMCSNPPLFNYTDYLYFNPPNMRSSKASSTLEAMNDFREY